MSELRISPQQTLPKTAATWVISYLAKRGAGKTYNAAVQAEEMLKTNIPIVVIDGMGIWWGLRAGVDENGKLDPNKQGYPVVVFGGEHADLPLNPEKAEEMAKAIVETNISCVLDLSTFSKYTARKIVTAFLNELYRLNRVERHIFIEESDMFAPQKPLGNEENMCLSAVDNFVRRGGNHNLGVTLITQRAAVLNKNILTQSDCLVILRTLAPQDKKAIQAWVEEQTDRNENDEWYDSLKELANGEAWIWKPENPAIFKKVQFRQRETFHATREFIKSPQANRIILMNVNDFLAKFKTAFNIEKPKEIQQNGNGVNKELIDGLNNQIKELQKQINEAKEYNQKITEAEAERCDQLEQAHKKLAAYNKLKEAFQELIPQTSLAAPTQLPISTATAINLDYQETNVIVNHTEKTYELTTNNQQGQIMYTAINDMPKEGFTETEIASALQEHGWRIPHNSLAPTLATTLLKQGLLVKIEGSKPIKYRLPTKVKIIAKNN